jgi:hypothetical protein
MTACRSARDPHTRRQSCSSAASAIRSHVNAPSPRRAPAALLEEQRQVLAFVWVVSVNAPSS